MNTDSVKGSDNHVSLTYTWVRIRRIRLRNTGYLNFSCVLLCIVYTTQRRKVGDPATCSSSCRAPTYFPSSHSPYSIIGWSKVGQISIFQI